MEVSRPVGRTNELPERSKGLHRQRFDANLHYTAHGLLLVQRRLAEGAEVRLAQDAPHFGGVGLIQWLQG
jgi:hypothetical protein